tara:strand:- start:13 stop:339 length:327 start_codon:yes stop_codon:yes gene_type:complete
MELSQEKNDSQLTESSSPITKLEAEQKTKTNSAEKEVKRLVNLIKDMDLDIYRKRREINELTRDVEDIKNMLYGVCEHIWLRDRSDDGAYGRSFLKCTKCNLYRKYTW